MAAYGLKGSGSFTALHRPLSCKAGIDLCVKSYPFGMIWHLIGAPRLLVLPMSLVSQKVLQN